MEGEKFFIQIKCFHLIGFQRNESKRFPRIHRIVPAFLVLCKVFFVASQALYAVQNFNDVVAVAEACATLFTGIITISKIISLSISKEKFYELMDEIEMLSQGANEANRKINTKFNKLEKQMTLVYSIATFCAGALFCVTPMIKNSINMAFFEADYSFEMPMKSAFPYDVTSAPTYHLTYFVFCVAIFVTIFINIGVDSLFLGSCLHISVHLDILRESVDEDKKVFIESHITVLKLAEKLNNLVKPIVFTQFLISSMQLCVIGFHLVVSESIEGKIVLAPFGFCVISNLFIYASGGQLIRDKSENVADNLYTLDKDSVIIIARAQRPAIIKSGIYEASLPTFAAILSSAGSMMTVLQSFI